jgi:hypothetical protein
MVEMVLVTVAGVENSIIYAIAATAWIVISKTVSIAPIATGAPVAAVAAAMVTQIFAMIAVIQQHVGVAEAVQIATTKNYVIAASAWTAI